MSHVDPPIKNIVGLCSGVGMLEVAVESACERENGVLSRVKYKYWREALPELKRRKKSDRAA